MFFDISPNFFSGVLLDSVKFFLLAGFVLYLAFALISVRQIEIMRKTIITPLSTMIRILGYAHLLFAAGMLFLALSLL